MNAAAAGRSSDVARGVTPVTRPRKRSRAPPAPWSGRLRDSPAPPRAPVISTPLCRLPPELLRRVLQRIPCVVSLLRLSQTCKHLALAARESPVWEPILLGFFDGALPPEVEGAALLAEPLRALRKEVLVGRQLETRERELRMFAIPRAAGSEAVFAAPGFEAWRVRLDEAVAARRAEGGASSAARGRRLLSSPLEVSVRCYGKFARTDCVHRGALAVLKAPAAEATFTHWTRRPQAAVADTSPDELLDAGGLPRRWEADFGLLAEWKDETLAEVGARAGCGAWASAQGQRLARRRRDGLYAPDDERSEPLDRALDDFTELLGAHALPKLLAGAYGGVVEWRLVPPCMGVGPYLEMRCAAVGRSRSAVVMDF